MSVDDGSVVRLSRLPLLSSLSGVLQVSVSRGDLESAPLPKLPKSKTENDRWTEYRQLTEKHILPAIGIPRTTQNCLWTRNSGRRSDEKDLWDHGNRGVAQLRHAGLLDVSSFSSNPL